MLTSLFIKNFALIDEIGIDFRSGLTVLTGETGAGKSIVIGALGLVLGGRADTTMIRQGAEKSVIEAEFDASVLVHLRGMVEGLGAEWQPVLILRREISLKGNSRCFVNDSPLPVSGLRALGDLLIDIHGQHEHQSLLRQETHRGVLDSYGGHAAQAEEYRNAFASFNELLMKREQALDRRDKIEERRVIAGHQLREIQLLDPAGGEDETIVRELKVVEHAEKLAVHAHELLELLYDGERNVADDLGSATRLLGELIHIDTSLQPLSSEIESASAVVAETTRTIRDYLDDVDFTPERAEQLRHRLAELDGLKRKFRLSLSDILLKRDQLELELEQLDSIDDVIETLEKAVETSRAECSRLASRLSRQRKNTGKKLGKAIAEKLGELGINNAVFETKLDSETYTGEKGHFLTSGDKRVRASVNGWDDVEFWLSANVGEQTRPLAKVVSGGEVSRIMLALKTLFAGRESIPIMVFDEIDVGVSGQIAQKVGAAMKQLSESHQIIAITHLPQIAGLGDTHLVVEKQVAGKRTQTGVRRLPDDERATEVARLLSGEHITEASIRSARELMQTD